MSDFNNKLADLCREAMKSAGNDREAQAEMIERLVNAVAFTVAIACEGQSRPMDVMLAGCEQQLYEAAARHKAAGALMAGLRR